MSPTEEDDLSFWGVAPGAEWLGTTGVSSEESSDIGIKIVVCVSGVGV
jgi:hypothetical protein